jgi:hypothetical protein
MRPINLTSFIVGIFITIGGMAAADPSYATSLVGSTSSAAGFDGLSVDGVLYDVTFDNASYDTVYSSSAPTFFGKAGLADDAALALSSALTAAGVTNLVGYVSPGGLQVALVPYADAGGLFTGGVGDLPIDFGVRFGCLERAECWI